MGVDAVGGAGHQGDVVLAVHHFQFVHLGGQHDGDLVHLVGQLPVQHGDGEGVAHLQSVQMGEQLGAGQAAVGRDHRMGALAAHRQAGAFQMACRHLQHSVAGAVIDGQLHTDLFNGDVAHNAGAGHVQRGAVGGKAVGVVQGIRVGGDLLIEDVGGIKIGRVVGVGQAVHLLGVAVDNPGLVALVDVIADGRVEHHRKAHKENEDEQDGAGVLFHGKALCAVKKERRRVGRPRSGCFQGWLLSSCAPCASW